MKLSQRQNSTKFSWAESCIKMWKFSDVPGTNSVHFFNEVSTRNVGKPSHLDTAAQENFTESCRCFANAEFNFQYLKYWSCSLHLVWNDSQFVQHISSHILDTFASEHHFYYIFRYHSHFCKPIFSLQYYVLVLYAILALVPVNNLAIYFTSLANI